jgi:hypothetical protein
MKFKLLIVILFASGFADSQTAWVREKNELYSSASAQFTTATKYFNPAGNLVITNSFYAGGLYVYNEFGITQNITAIVSMPIVKLQGFETTNTVLGLGDLLIGAKFGFFQHVLPLSYTIEFELPTGTSELLAVNKVNTFETINLPTGDGEFNIHNKISASHSFYPSPFYASCLIDFNYRTKFQDLDFNNQLAGGLEIGYETPNKYWLIFKYNSLKTLGAVKENTDFTRGEGTSFSTIQLETVIPISKKWYLSGRVGFFTDLPVARVNVYSAPLFGLSLAYKGLIK